MNIEKTKRGQRGRPISFDKSQLVNSVMHKFWELGYNKVSLNEIARDNGLTRASLYHSFDSKEALFLLSLKQYLKTSPDTLLDEVGSPNCASDVLFEFLDRVCETNSEDDRRRGCFICNCVNELITSDSPLATQLRQIMETRKQRVTQLMEIAVANGEIATSNNPVLLGNMFINFLFGLNTFSKTTADNSQLRALCDGFMNSIGFYRHEELQQQVC